MIMASQGKSPAATPSSRRPRRHVETAVRLSVEVLNPEPLGMMEAESREPGFRRDEFENHKARKADGANPVHFWSVTEKSRLAFDELISLSGFLASKFNPLLLPPRL
ncbi:MAG TPA: hypothetical protein VF683_03345 [Chthoniobacterales bacterium]